MLHFLRELVLHGLRISFSDSDYIDDRLIFFILICTSLAFYYLVSTGSPPEGGVLKNK